MGYDLLFKHKGGNFTRRHFLDYFSSRMFYKTSSDMVMYENETTGVYFQFEYFDDDQSPNAEDPSEEYFPVAFYLNYMRPSFFVLEAEPEVREFVRNCSMLVLDPQADDTAAREYDPQGFVDTWQYGNVSGYQVVVQEDIKVHTLPATTLQRIWKWNYGRNQLQAAHGENVFVPKIMVFDHLGQTVTGVAWADAIPIVIPRVDLLIMVRERLAPRKWFVRPKDAAVVQLEEFETLLSRHVSVSTDEPHCITYLQPAWEIEQAIKKLPRTDLKKLVALPFDNVLDRELLETIKKGPDQSQ